jgi:adenine-specific DNA-methyltransferase
MNLSDKEKELVIQAIKNNQPIPKEYIYKMHSDEEDVFLFWNGRKEDITNVALPFHHIEHIDEPRKEANEANLLFDMKGRQKAGWHNKLIWGDNKLILSSLANGPLREEIEKEGGLKLVYIDPPFAVGADFSHDIELNGETATKSQSVLEEIAYRDTWQKGISSYLSMMYERLKLIYNLLAEDGSIYVHCDWRVEAYIKMLLDDIFGTENIKNLIAWNYETYAGSVKNYYPRKHDTIFFYTKSDKYTFELPYLDDFEDSINFKRWKDYIVEGNKIKGSNYPKTDSRFMQRYNKWVRVNGREPNDDDVIFEIKSFAVSSTWKDIKPVDPKDLKRKITISNAKTRIIIRKNNFSKHE